MKTNFNLAAISVAVLAAFGLTACGGSGAFDGGISTTTIFDGNTANSGNTGSTGDTNNSGTTTGDSDTTTDNTNTSTTGDSSDYTTFTDDYVSNNAEITEVPKYYYAGGTAGSLLSDLSAEYGAKKADGTAKFEAMEGYRATITSPSATITSPSGTINLRSMDVLNLDALGKGYQQQTLTETAVANIDGVQYTGNRTSRVRLYQQANSVVLGRQTLSGKLSNGSSTKILSQGALRIDQLKGIPTSAEDIATLVSDRNASKYTYSGQAFSQGGTGTLTYSVDFYDRSGSGTITGLADKGTINLNQGRLGTVKHVNPDGEVYDMKTKEKVGNELTAIGIQGVANFASGSADGTYTLGFFGPNAVEIAGIVTENNTNTVGFGGTKQ